MATIVSIGKNVKGYEMENRKWDEFKNALMTILEANEVEFFFTGEGLGIYGKERETAFTVVFKANFPVRQLVTPLKALKKKFDQEAIALTSGKTIFV